MVAATAQTSSLYSTRITFHFMCLVAMPLSLLNRVVFYGWHPLVCSTFSTRFTMPLKFWCEIGNTLFFILLLCSVFYTVQTVTFFETVYFTTQLSQHHNKTTFTMGFHPILPWIRQWTMAHSNGAVLFGNSSHVVDVEKEGNCDGDGERDVDGMSIGLTVFV